MMVQIKMMNLLSLQTKIWHQERKRKIRKLKRKVDRIANRLRVIEDLSKTKLPQGQNKKLFSSLLANTLIQNMRICLIQVRMKVCQTTRLEDTILFMLEKCFTIDMSSSKNLVGDIFLLFGCPKTCSTIHMLHLRFRNLVKTIWKQHMMKQRSQTK